VWPNVFDHDGPESPANKPFDVSRELPSFDTKVLELVAEGLSDRDVARHLKVPIDRVKRAVRDAMVRLSARNRTEAVVRAITAGFLGRWRIKPDDS
jgi:DNA-binding NarL/FixJ family response regulator